MSFFETEFPRDINMTNVTGGPQFSTTINTGFGGFEQRNQNWAQTRAQYTIDLDNKQKAYWNKILSLFYNVGGQRDGFRFFDDQDNAATGSLFGTGDGVTQTFQLAKVYTYGPRTFSRIIKKPITSAVLDFNGNPLADSYNVYVAAALQARPSQYELDYTTGLVTFASMNTVSITAAVRSGANTTYTYTLTGGAGLVAGQSITVALMDDTGNNGTWIIGSLGTGTFTVPNAFGVTTSTPQVGTGLTAGVSVVAITAASQSGVLTTYTYTLSSGAALVPGMRITIQGMAHPGNNGVFYVASLGSGTFTVINASGSTQSEAGVGVTDWTPAVGAALTADFSFHVPVRFGADLVAGQAQVPPNYAGGGQQLQITWQSVLLQEIRIA